MIYMTNYIVSKVLNNNVILAINYDTKQELILIGKGIGFRKKEGKVVCLSEKDIEKSFIAYDEKTKKEYLQLLNQLDGKVMGVSEEIIAVAEKKLGTLNPHIHIALTDHIGFAIDRLKMGLQINNPFLYEIRALYPEEFQMGLIAADIIKDRLKINISESEVGFIAMHLHSARQNRKVTDTMKDTKLIKEIVDIIRRELNVSIELSNLTYTRLINHLRVTVYRLQENKCIENPLLSSIRQQFSNSYEIALKIGQYIGEKKHILVPEDELGYMALHIERLKESSKLISKRVTESNQA